MLDLLSDVFLIAGAFGLAFYCMVLSRRLKTLARSDAGLGASISALSDRVDTLAETARKAVDEAEGAAARLAALNEEAERREGELSFLLAGMDDIPAQPQEPPAPPEPPEPIFARRSQGTVR